MARFSLVLLAFAFGASTTLGAPDFNARHASHEKLARLHASGNLTARSNTPQRDWKLEKRFDNARCTLYEAGLGACGGTNKDTDMIVALNVEQYGNGEHCNEWITITYNGKSQAAQVVDKCEICPYGGIDLTPSLFEIFAPQSEGVITASWTFGNGGDTSSSSSPTPSPTSTHHTTSSTWTPETTSRSSTSTWSSSSSTSTSSSSSGSSTVSSSTTTSSSVATPSASANVNTDSVLDLLNYGVVQLGGFISEAVQVNLETSEST